MIDDDDEYVEESSGNLWADLGEPDAAELHARSQLMRHITLILRERGLTQVQAAALLGTTQPVVSDLMRGKLSKFSIERLFSFLEALGHDVEIVVHPRGVLKRRSTRVTVARRSA
ncbi:MAG TPA: helix-turn-helix transcriptional regulator [Longimicrobium sp.]|jgi:predicted XRE-type DNA-binding protein|nr:helix-turn-helix transcriptional regulator [Longimicrobium sp.]